MKKNRLTKMLAVTLLSLAGSFAGSAQGWPSAYTGVMLQGFYWNSYADTKWTVLESEAEDLATTFDLIWIPNAGNCGSGSQMGYSPKYWFSNYSSSFGTKAELLSLVQTLASKGVGIIGDVVINHRANQTNWTDFYSETYNGITYRLTASDITSDDDGGATASHLQSGETLGNADTGDDWSGIRDLDHTSTNVRNTVKAYLGMLTNDFGYAGFRYDMSSGFSASYIAEYNNSARPTYSVGECWKDGLKIKNWIDGTASSGTPTSAAFDFQFRYTVRNAINNNDWTKLGETNTVEGVAAYPLVSPNFDNSDSGASAYRRWAVTFIENHDTEVRSASQQQDPIRSDTLAANAYMLAMPGTPCVFLKHWQDYKEEIKNMVALRKLLGISNTSTYTQTRSNSNYFVVTTLGSTPNVATTRLVAIVGNNTAGYTPSSTQFKLALEGYHYKYYVGVGLNSAWVDKPSGTYDTGFDVKATALSSRYTTLAYTTDGTAPSGSSSTVADGNTIHIDSNMADANGKITLKIALKNGNNIVANSTITREYKIQATKRITVYFKAPTGTWNSVYYYMWDSSNNKPFGNFPGAQIAATTTVHGDTFYYHTFESTDENFKFNLIISNGSSGNNNQTVNITNISEDVYYELGSNNGGAAKYSVVDVSTQYTTPLTATVYFKDPGWSDVYFYQWDSGNNKALGNWPGARITATTTVNGDTYYYHTFDKTTNDYAFNVIFHDNNGTQTVNVEGITDDVYYELGSYNGGKWTVQEVGSFTPYSIGVYLKDPGWTAVNVHAWDGSGNIFGNWPGATALTTTIDGDTYYYQTVTKQSADYSFNAIFNNNNNGIQTVNIEGITEDVYYELGPMSGGQYTVIPVGSFQPHTARVYLKVPDWETVNFYAWDSNGALLGSWPGTATSQTVVKDGVTYLYQDFTISSSDYTFNVIFNDGNNNQTIDLTDISDDVYYEIGPMANGKYFCGAPGTICTVVTAYFKDPSWSNVYYYGWGDIGNPLGSWPGTEVTQTCDIHGDTFYYYDLVLTGSNPTYNLIFTNNDGTQTGDLTGLTGTVYYEYTGTGDAKVEAITPLPYDVTLYFKQPSGSDWDDIYFYTWGDGSTQAWPGSQSYDVKKIDGEPWYYHEFTVTAPNFSAGAVINNGAGIQTVDITDITNDVYYTLGEYNGEKYEVVNAGDMTEIITGIAIDVPTLTIGLYSHNWLSASVSGTHISSPVEWTTSDPSVVTIKYSYVSPLLSHSRLKAEQAGVQIYGTGDGTATITASIGEFASTCSVTVDSTTGITLISDGDAKVSRRGDYIIIESESDGIAQISTLDGRSHQVLVKRGINRYPTSDNIVLVRLQAKTFKLVR